ncbi:MAG: aminopeptidase P family N-terminal domain-containing protein [Chloroflexota bacterium]|nr:aminopeptidase P family N-terminal domain-containing protein [Chloroflexota bacterium]
MGKPRLARIDLPDFGMPDAMPDLPPSIYPARVARLREAAAARGLDRIVVYADREHSANLAYLTGFDPRFEEAVLVLGDSGEPAILVGNECYGMAGAAPLPMRRHLFQDLSLPGQPRDRSRPLAEILADEGIGRGSRVGVAGWKTYARPETIEAPAFLVDELRRIVGSGGTVENATDLLIDAGVGLRTDNEVEQLATFEYAACQTSQGVRQVMFGLQPGMTEQEAVRLLGWNGMPLSCHLMLTSGKRASLGLLSPGDRRIEHGDRFTVAFGVWGALNCRAGFVLADAKDLPAAIQDYVARLVEPYFGAVAEWYGALRIGQTGGTLHEIIQRHLGDPFFGIFLNPGHQIHLDEWVNSPIAPGSRIELRSGMAFQVDIIPATGTDYFTTNIEDGVALADAGLRAAFAAGYPAAWERIQARRRFMKDALGIDLHPDVLPFSNIPAYLAPFLLRRDQAMTVAD